MIGTFLKKYRLSHNLTQCEMAKKLSTSQSYYNRLELDLSQPGVKMIKKIALALDMTPEEMRTVLFNETN